MLCTFFYSMTTDAVACNVCPFSTQNSSIQVVFSPTSKKRKNFALRWLHQGLQATATVTGFVPVV